APRQPIEPVGQASSACNACRRSALETGWALTKDVSAASPKMLGAICRQASQSMQVESTKKPPGTLSGTRFLGFAMNEPLLYILPAWETLELHHRRQAHGHAAVHVQVGWSDCWRRTRLSEPMPWEVLMSEFLNSWTFLGLMATLFVFLCLMVP